LPETVTVQGEEASDYNDSLEFNPVTGDVEATKPIVEGLEYQVRSLVPNVSFASMNDSTIPSIEDRQNSADLPTYLPSNVYEVPTDFCPPARGANECPLQDSRIYKIAQRWTKDGDTPFEKLLLLQNRFRGGYQHRLPGRAEVNEVEVKASASADYLVEFLTETKTGYCQQFATAFAVLARMLGYPARVSVGFLPGETSIERPTHYLVRGNDAHAWPEVYFNEAGWVAFEPTPRSAAPPPAYTQQQTPGSGVNPPALDPAATRGGRGGQGPRGFRDPANVRPGRARAQRDRVAQPDVWHDSFLRLAALFGGIAVLFLIGTPLAKVALNRRRYLRAKGPRAVAGAAFAEFEQEAADLASARFPSESAHSYVKRLIAMQKIPTRPALRLVDIFEEATYGPAAVSDVQSKEAVRLTRDLRRELWADATWMVRAGRLFSPTVVLAELRPNGQPGGALSFLRVGRARGSIRPSAEQR
jgi:transglutaminase-like putative cysteine protease